MGLPWEDLWVTVSTMAAMRTNMPHEMGPNLNCSGVNKCAMKSDINNITV